MAARDVADYSIGAGNPARQLPLRSAPAVIDRLLARAWRDWPLGQIRAAVPAFPAGGIRAREDPRP